MDKRQLIQKIDITRVENNKPTVMKDSIVDENILQIIVNKTNLFKMVFSMTHTRALAAGFLFTQGIVHRKTDIKKMTCIRKTKKCHVTLNTSAMGRLNEFKKGYQIKGSSGGVLLQHRTDILPPDPKVLLKISYDQVLCLIQQHWNHSGLFHETGIPIVISNAAPTLSAVKLAEKAGLTIIGFARNNRFNIYTHKARIARETTD